MPPARPVVLLHWTQLPSCILHASSKLLSYSHEKTESSTQNLSFAAVVWYWIDTAYVFCRARKDQTITQTGELQISRHLYISSRQHQWFVVSTLRSLTGYCRSRRIRSISRCECPRRLAGAKCYATLGRTTCNAGSGRGKKICMSRLCRLT